MPTTSTASAEKPERMMRASPYLPRPCYLGAAVRHSDHMRGVGAIASLSRAADKDVRPPMSTPPARGILFDKDGTLIDFRATWVPAYRGVADELAARLGGGAQLASALLARQGYDAATDSFAADSRLLWASNEQI